MSLNVFLQPLALAPAQDNVGDLVQSGLFAATAQSQQLLCVLPGDNQSKDLLPSPLLAACHVILLMSGVQIVRRGQGAHLPKCQ